MPSPTDIRPPFTEQALAYASDCEWRNRDETLRGRDEIKAFLRGQWERELDYRLRKELWAFTDDRIAVRFEYESRDAQGKWSLRAMRSVPSALVRVTPRTQAA